MAFLKHKGRTICYRLLGDNDKPLLILAHALGMTQGAWDEVIPGLLSKFRILTWDLPGHGGSAAWPEASEQISAEDLAAEALALADLAGANTFYFAGTSIGGVVGQQLLAYHEHRLTSAVLTNTGAVIGTRDGWATRSADVLQKGLNSMSAAIVPRWFSTASCQQQPALVEGWTVIMSRGDDRSYALLCEMLGTCDFSEKLQQLRTPLLLVGGSDDVATPPALLETLAQISGAAAPIILEQVGHVPSVECPGELSQILIDYMV
ncbi:MAG: alpha/beta fold hydrolase [Pseudomonas sp.]|jgi:3-oxoadipate enol-lactonase|uniref:Alpha/beta fold hydrolase n=1 Tax=Pseudomonas neustonica TaxID=2487346 RepID=A0ABX9XER9_9PSED|nr:MULTISPECIES: alpha/beta fold hydrolase [Pseudomonas]MBA6421036.1 alpha/beta fold hydrolase [Pseudomonas sp. 5Ae-yellow]MBL4834950.1 alpha/beta fold hydrolase [Pseudomonas sp.]ROZ80951.1 alpha/beta fold hydrolase [Pseudomonas sp. SSM44]ROZ82149.1 alpha/beta fold hydrolase [Pseudomonas neustonica]|tara:strand:+ start:16758 stop:17546 length:789 start_codon:yes stop_codon:yes gene_type:complete